MCLHLVWHRHLAEASATGETPLSKICFISKSNGVCRNRQPVQKFLSSNMLPNPNFTVDSVYRSDWGRIVATLIRHFGDFEIAEEAAQEAFAAAVNQWRTEGVPESPDRKSTRLNSSHR